MFGDLEAFGHLEDVWVIVLNFHAARSKNGKVITFIVSYTDWTLVSRKSEN